MIEVIAEHSVETSLLPEKANIADIGCRGFEFSDYFRNLGHNVIAIDCDNYLQGDYHSYAISNFDGFTSIKRTSDPQATRITKEITGESIRTLTIQSFCGRFKIDFFDLIKMDIESSEYEVIMSMEKPYAKQLSIEFHLHTGAYGDSEMREMEDKLVSLGYVPVSHEMSRMHGAGLNFWNSLWIWFENKRVK